MGSKIYFLLASVLIMLCTNSCSNHDVADETAEVSQILCLKSSVSPSKMQAIIDTIGRKFSLTKSDGSIDFSEEEAEALLEPLVIDGKNLQASFLEQMYLSKTKFANDDFLLVENMPDDQLALFSFIVYAANGQHIVTKVSSDKIWECLGAVSGLSVIKDLSVTGLVNAKTVLQVVKALGSRYLGYLGVATTIYSAIKCLS
ncbi:hypothetical protein [uncultured Mediterranea sp.]|uniref:hypothetical protein n=1 Tax=uncultured Mediterranea sp. TaxID=1926662 RepID=UPI0027D95540|nr:hypothetical protein [uncultured Mediterranea sp.]